MDPLTSDVTASCHDAAPQALLRGVMQFNRGEFYACHETLEDLWMAEERPIRRLYQGILQIAVALHHWGRGNYRGALALLDSGCGNLTPFSGVCRQIDIASLRTDGEALKQQLEHLGPQNMEQLDVRLIPRIVLHPTDPNAGSG